MVAELVVAVVLAMKALTGGGVTLNESLEWMRYLLVANIVACAAMFVGAAMAIPELARFKVSIGGLAISAIGFLVATLLYWWSFHLLTELVDIITDPTSTAKDLTQTVERFAGFKDLGYGVGLVTLLRTVQRSAAASDQITLAHEAGHHSRALMVMVAADLFYQLAMANGAASVIGLVASLLVLAYWIYCHVRLPRFLGAAAYFMNEPHDLPVARATKIGDARAVKPAPAPVVAAAAAAPVRPSRPAIAPPPIVLAAPAPAPAPATPRSSEPGDSTLPADGPRFLR
jgi:hypothetical protein